MHGYSPDFVYQRVRCFILVDLGNAERYFFSRKKIHLCREDQTMRSKPRKPTLSFNVENLLDERLPFPLARKAKRGMFPEEQLERLLEDEGADMAEIQMIMDEYKRRYGD
jgi:hypothetical protein